MNHAARSLTDCIGRACAVRRGNAPRTSLLSAILLTLLLAACGSGPAIDQAVLAPPSPVAVPSSAEPNRVVLPQDDAPHGDLTEWWYYTGHLTAQRGRAYGFELVIFRSVHSGNPPAYAAHFAVTDHARQRFQFAQRAETGKQVHAGPGFNLDMNGWTMRGSGNHELLQADMSNYAIDLALTSLKPAVLHDGKGLISFGAAGNSYYYSRTRLSVKGTITDHGQRLPVSGIAWMDHQWGNFISGGGGWDWFSIQLNDDTELMLFFLRDASGKPILPYGTFVAPSGKATILPSSSFSERATGSWTSPQSGITYPSGWIVKAAGLSLKLTPTVKNQELRTTQTTGITYWEGDVQVAGTTSGGAIGGVGYVELVGYH